MHRPTESPSPGCRREWASFQTGLTALALLFSLAGCGGSDASSNRDNHPLLLRAVTFNTGTTPGLDHDGTPDDGYTSVEAAISDEYYGDGLSWLPVVEASRRFLESVNADVIAFQEIFYSGECAAVPAQFRRGFVCETWVPGDPSVAQHIVGNGYQVACNLEKPDKCIAVKRELGSIRGCDADLCLDGLDGARVADCGGGSRVGRGVIELRSGGTLTVVNVHGTSGFTRADVDCRTRQFEQVFVDLGQGDAQPAANGERNLILGDLNNDPGRAQSPDVRRFLEFVGPGKRFGFISPVGPTVPPSYAGIFNIDHVVSDVLTGDCWVAGITPGHPSVTDAVYFDHNPIVCEVREHPSGSLLPRRHEGHEERSITGRIVGGHLGGVAR